MSFAVQWLVNYREIEGGKFEHKDTYIKYKRKSFEFDHALNT